MILKHLEAIQQHFREWYPKEGCGVIGVVKGKSKWFPCENLAMQDEDFICLLYTSPSPRDGLLSRMPSSA